MWPGQQPPGGEQNPQGPNPQGQNPQAQNNPYQQSGYQQPNPYQQPGFQQPNPYAQQPQWQAPVPAGSPQPSQGGGGGNRTKLVAIVAAVAVVVAAGVTGFLVLGGKKDDKAGGGKTDGKPSSSASASADPSATDSSSDDDPRGAETEKPTIPGWKLVVNTKWGIAFDVPADWEVQNPGVGIGFDFPDSEKDKGINMSGTAEYKSKWCTSDSDKDGRTDDTPLAVVGTKGADGAKNTDEIAVNTPPWWVFGGYTQPDKKSITFDKKATPFKTTSGVEGSIAWAQSANTPKKGKCVTDGKALTFGFKNSADDYVSFNFFGAKGVKDEVSKATVLKVLSTVRLHGTPTG
ncbi:hypothetical protein [Streptomyces sp. NBC_00078]|uniref:hypothetical protein n=1 Tax=unclassified Streptomyces TaxID=2593676 RepID=UPI002257A4C0|nr:hypothetical protein [Streptomyces sp. NBC_00078]MCX5419191.1 hypothetical protein [Streptomyces sp. NBC_00078]